VHANLEGAPSTCNRSHFTPPSPEKQKRSGKLSVRLPSYAFSFNSESLHRSGHRCTHSHQANHRDRDRSRSDYRRRPTRRRKRTASLLKVSASCIMTPLTFYLLAEQQKRKTKVSLKFLHEHQKHILRFTVVGRNPKDPPRDPPNLPLGPPTCSPSLTPKKKKGTQSGLAKCHSHFQF